MPDTDPMLELANKIANEALPDDSDHPEYDRDWLVIRDSALAMGRAVEEQIVAWLRETEGGWRTVIKAEGVGAPHVPNLLADAITNRDYLKWKE